MKGIRSFCLLTALFILLGSFSAVSAAAAAKLIEGVSGGDGVLTVYSAAPGSDFVSNSGYEISLSLDGTNLPLESITTVGDADVGIAYYTLVDCSGSMRGEMENIRTVLTRIAEGLGDNDCIVIGMLGETLETSGILKEKEEVSAFIDSLTSRHEETNLFEGIVKAADWISANTELPVKRCMIVFSDGVDYTSVGYTQHEVENCVEQCRFSVYTVAMRNPSERPEKTKLLGSFARLSCGGQAFDMTDDGVEIADNILNAVRRGLVIRSVLPESMKLKDTASLRMSIKSGTGSYEDSVTVETSFMKRIETPYREKGRRLLPFLLGTVGVIVLLAAAVFLIFRVRMRKKKAAKNHTNVNNGLMTERRKKATLAVPESPPFRLRLQAVGYPDISCEVGVWPDRWTTVGSSSQADAVPKTTDVRLASVHCAFRSDGSLVLIRALAARDTGINGISLPTGKESSFRLTDDRLIHMGSYDYRVRLMNR